MRALGLMVVGLWAGCGPQRPGYYGGGQAPSREVTSAFPTTIEPPTDAAYADIYRQLIEAAIPASTGELVSKLWLLDGLSVPMRVANCDGGAFYDPAKREIVLCYDYLRFANDLNPHRTGSYAFDVYTRTVILWSVLHEIGHALVDWLDIPHKDATENEDLADQFAVLMIADTGDADLTRRVLEGPIQFFAEHAEYMHRQDADLQARDVHRPSDQRAMLTACIAYGRDGDRELLSYIGKAEPYCVPLAKEAISNWNGWLRHITRVRSGNSFGEP